MNSRERLLTVLAGRIPDCVPVAPDFSNMIPARRTGKPFWDIYLYNDPPLGDAYVACVKHFSVDSLLNAYYVPVFPPDGSDEPQYEQFIVFRNEHRIVTQTSWVEDGKREWRPTVDVYYVADPPTHNVKPEKIGLPSIPKRYEPLEGVKPATTGAAGLRHLKQLMGDHGLVGVSLASSCALNSPEDIYGYYDNPDKHAQWAAERVVAVEERFERILALEERPDFLSVGGSGTLIFQTVEIFRQLAFPAVKRGIELAAGAGFPTHVHSCGPERELIKIFAGETALTVIDPLEQPPMGDCNLGEMKRLYGAGLVLKGNLHTTRDMLRGSPEDVAAASRRAIDQAAEGGRFILSTGDQCGRDTPDENLHAMVETARTYGRY